MSPDPNAIIVQSNGFGVESFAILLRWDREPESRPFVDWSQVIIVSSQVGEEHKVDTIAHCEAHMLPIIRKHNIRFVELARRGHLEEDGIVILQDTRQPYKLHPDGVYKLSDELLHSGTVPQFGGEHRCAMKFKAFVIETWLAWEFRNDQSLPVYHVFGYNSGEGKRIEKSDFHIARHNEDRLIPVDGRPPLEVFGFNSGEGKRIERSKLYDGPTRTGLYPLQIWGWDRAKCEAYIFECIGIYWRKSHCSFCPFCGEAAKGLDEAVTRWRAAPEQTAHGLMVEFNSLCFNPRGHLYRDKALIDVIREKDVTEVLDLFEENLATCQWAVYRVRRIYTMKGKAVRCVERISELKQDLLEGEMGSRRRAYRFLGIMASSPPFECEGEIWRGIRYEFFTRREPDKYPTREGFYVAAPAFMETKLRGPIETFNKRWNRVGCGLPMNEEPFKATHKIKIDGEWRKLRLVDADDGRLVDEDGDPWSMDEDVIAIKPRKKKDATSDQS